MRKRWMFFGPLALVGVVVFGLIGGTVVQLLWNWLLPPMFGLHEITFWQAFGILALSRILFGGFGMRGGGHRGRWRYGMGVKLADRIGDRWDAMTPEERERFRQRMRERCGFDPSAT